MNYIKTPQGIFTVTIFLAVITLLALLRSDSGAQTNSTVGGRFQMLSAKDDLVIFDTATARAWRYQAELSIPGGSARLPATWNEFSPQWAAQR